MNMIKISCFLIFLAAAALLMYSLKQEQRMNRIKLLLAEDIVRKGYASAELSKDFRNEFWVTLGSWYKCTLAEEDILDVIAIVERKERH
jgi:hypothetical protein